MDGATPTAFRSRFRDDLVPTLKQLQRTQPDAALRWFYRGRFWASPEEEREAFESRRRMSSARGDDWRPGGLHKDPRAKYQKTRDQKRAQFKRRSWSNRPSGPGVPAGPAGPASPADPPAGPKGAGSPPPKAWSGQKPRKSWNGPKSPSGPTSSSGPKRWGGPKKTWGGPKRSWGGSPGPGGPRGPKAHYGTKGPRRPNRPTGPRGPRGPRGPGRGSKT